MGTDKRKLTEDQRKILNGSEAGIAQAFEELKRKLVGAGYEPAEAHGRAPAWEGTPCHQCDCPAFQHSGLHGLLKCARPTCGHGFVWHDVL